MSEKMEKHQITPAVPPEDAMDQGQPIEVRREDSSSALGKVGLDEHSLQGAGVLRANQAQAAQDVARGHSDQSRLGSNQAAHDRAGQIRNETPENIEPAGQEPVSR